MNMVHVRYYSGVYGCKRGSMFGACNSYHQNQQNSWTKPTRNWEHTPSLFEASQNLSASRNIVFTYFQVCVTEMASSQYGKMCHVSCSFEATLPYQGLEMITFIIYNCEAGDAPFVDSELLGCLKLLKIDVGNYVILELGQLCKQISVPHEIDIESKKENGYG